VLLDILRKYVCRRLQVYSVDCYIYKQKVMGSTELLVLVRSSGGTAAFKSRYVGTTSRCKDRSSTLG